MILFHLPTLIKIPEASELPGSPYNYLSLAIQIPHSIKIILIYHFLFHFNFIRFTK